MEELFEACELGDIKSVRRLIEQGADIEAKDVDGWTPLIYAVRNNCLEVVQYLIEHGANIEIKDKYGNTPLLFAARNNRVETVQYLIEQGANIKVINYRGWTPFIFAAWFNYSEIVQHFILKQVDPNSLFLNDKEVFTICLRCRFVADFISQNAHMLTPVNLLFWKEYRLKTLFEVP